MLLQHGLTTVNQLQGLIYVNIRGPFGQAMHAKSLCIFVETFCLKRLPWRSWGLCRVTVEYASRGKDGGP